MPKKLTKEIFIERSLQAHGENKYKYDRVEYNSIDSEVQIYCNSHQGYFYQIPYLHMKGFGCAKCSKRLLKTTEEFVAEANQVHNFKYDYSLTDYKGREIKIIIKCHKHGEFFQEASNHLQGQGCPECKKKILSELKSLSKEEFLQRAFEKHGSKFDYSETNFSNGEIKITIICPFHGKFKQRPQTHLISKFGCLVCAGKKKLTKEEFASSAQEVHGNEYDYSCTIFKSIRKKVEIKCLEHGPFLINPKSHLKGIQCPRCAINSETKFLDLLEVPEQNRQIHIRIGCRRFRVDGLIDKIIFEFYGDFWHGNPEKYDLNKINKINNKTFRELHQNTVERAEILKRGGYQILFIWYSDFRKLIKNNSNIFREELFNNLKQG